MRDNTIMSFEVQIDGYEKINSLFAKAYCKIGYAGINRNGSYIKKETFQKAIPSLYYAPVVGEWIKDKNNFGGHGGKLEITSNEINYIDTTMPYGCVGAYDDLNSRWELGTDGKEYFTVDIYLWTHKFPELEKTINESSNQSMEINVVSGYQAVIDKQNVFVIEELEFSALCILGKDTENLENNVEPCFEDSEIIAYPSKENYFKEDFNLMIKELKYSLSNSTLSFNKWVDRIIDSKNLMEVDSRMKKVNKTTENFSAEPETTNAEVPVIVDDATTTDMGCKTENASVENLEESAVTVEVEVTTDSDETSETETETETTEDMSVETEKATASFEVIDNTIKEDTNENTIDNSEMTKKFEELNSNFIELKTNFDLLFEENNILKSKLEAKELEEKQATIDSIFAKFGNMLSEEDIKDIKTKAIDMETSEIEGQLYAIYGKKMAKFDNKPNGLIELGIVPEIKKADTEKENFDVFMKAKSEINK